MTPGSPPSTVTRRLVHHRRIDCRGYLRDDGLWEIEGCLLDTKPYPYEDRERGLLPPGHPIHKMHLQLILDAGLTVKQVNADMKASPFTYCMGALEPLQGLVGVAVGAGWRKQVDSLMKGRLGCSHLRELLYAMATAAFQTTAPYYEQFDQGTRLQTHPDTGLPFFVDACRTWDRDGPVIARFHPEWRRTRR